MVKIVKVAHGSPRYLELAALRRDVLRAPFGLDYTEEEMALEKEDIHLAALDKGKVVGTLLLHHFNDATAQMKRVAIAGEYQSKGVGAKLIARAEKIAAGRNYSLVIAHARASALPFYEKHGYAPIGAPFEDVTPIPHIRVEKALPRPFQAILA
jgi:GNAT superfamily N-acetyltransferase